MKKRKIMKKRRFTALERRLLRHRGKIVLLWSLMGAVYAYFFSIHWVLGLLMITSAFAIAPLYVSEGVYFPKDDYFRRCFRSMSKEEREEISLFSELLGKYPHLGEAVFLEDFLLFTKWGVLLDYGQIQNMTYKKAYCGRGKPDFYYVIEIQSTQMRQYRCYVWNTDAPFEGSNSMYEQATAWILSHRKK